MRVAFLILAHNNFDHLNKLILSLDGSNHDFYIHIDSKVSISNISIIKKRNVFCLKNRQRVLWGGFSQVQAILNLLNAASRFKPYDYYVLLSGADYPIRSNSWIDNFLTVNKGNEYINICKMPENGKSLSRVRNLFFEYEKNNEPLNLIKRLTNILLSKSPIKRTLPAKYGNFVLYGGSTWWCLSDNAIKYIQNFIKINKDYLQFYKNTLCPDEMFFHTILGNSTFKDSIMPSLTLSFFNHGSAHPVNIKPLHLPVFKQKFVKTSYGEAQVLFARKFSDQSSDILLKIDDLRKD